MRQIKMTEEEYWQYDDECVGFCTNCGEDQSCVEPDAQNYFCENCKSHSVQGVMTLAEEELIDIEFED